jgi:membrane-anchored glycerophosphoryl diester phosphodiesterase (GDPDase)
MIPFLVISIIQQNFIKNEFPVLSWESLGFVFVDIVALTIYFLVGLAGIYSVQDVITGNSLSVKRVFQASLQNLWRFSVLSILLFLMTLGGGLLLIIPGIIFNIWYIFSKYAFAEGRGIKSSLGFSRNLVRGRFWKITGRLIVFDLFYLVILVAESLIPFDLGSLLIAILGALFIIPSYLLYTELRG